MLFPSASSQSYAINIVQLVIISKNNDPFCIEVRQSSSVLSGKKLKTVRPPILGDGLLSPWGVFLQGRLKIPDSVKYVLLCW